MTQSRLPLIVALTGTIGSGKSLAATFFQRFGATVIDADILARKAVEPGSPALQKIIESFGPMIIYPDGTLDRKKLGKIIFSDKVQRSALEAIVHPEVRLLFLEELKKAQKSVPPPSLILYVIPLLFETGNKHPEIQKVITVYAPRELCLQRIIDRDKCTPLLAELKLGSQISGEEKKQLAHYVLNNDSTTKNLEEQVKALYTTLRALT